MKWLLLMLIFEYENEVAGCFFLVTLPIGYNDNIKIKLGASSSISGNQNEL
jgi:hypothetical protein